MTEDPKDLAQRLREIRDQVADLSGPLARDLDQLADDLAAAAAKPRYHIPGPYEIALAIGAALASSGTYATPGAAMTAAWLAVPEFFAGRDTYLRDLAPILFAMGDADGAAAEAH